MRSWMKFAWVGVPAILVGAVVATSSVAPAAAVGYGCSVDASGQYVCRSAESTGFVLERPVTNPAVGQRFFARVSDPSLLAGLGVDGLAVNERIEVEALGNGRFRATTASGQSRVVVLGAAGVQLAAQ